MKATIRPASEVTPTTPQNELRTSTLIYNPFQSNEADYHIGSEFDPDINFYCEQNTFSGFLCKYYKKVIIFFV